MGRRRKAMKKIKKKTRQVVATVFKCPFCAHDLSVECKMDFDRNVGYISCRICGAEYQSPIHYLSEPIDVYTDWIDECEAAQQEEDAG